MSSETRDDSSLKHFYSRANRKAMPGNKSTRSEMFEYDSSFQNPQVDSAQWLHIGVPVNVNQKNISNLRRIQHDTVGAWKNERKM